MVRKLLVLSLVTAVVVFAGCHTPLRGVVWAPIVKTESPLLLGDTDVGTENVGEATWEGILFLAKGDASITTAMKNGSKGPITRIHHVDLETLSVLGIYTEETVKVYGE